ncbi:tRNA (5-methylaminomethyl-2-thiouridine)(34)-methyltransferase MnmD [Gymnodinialimonas sp. 2305UL16-5]|uniref:tRNA (5-methylaminomethyl-2-thiouridine)(34)-methyltransferase MnmD n=1 Tax=Gymnodinialimonas mytili TaxID=3126503 RepID=UPI0030B4EFA5
MDKNQHKIEWRDTVPVSVQFDDPFYSLDDGVAETRHVFLQGNDLPARFSDGFHIAELGFGTGLNFLTALQAFRDSGSAGRLIFTSFEAYPMAPEDQRRALDAHKDLPIEALTSQTGPDYELTVIIGDARDMLAAWGGRADAWFLDGFSPAKNPEMWGPDLMEMVARHTVPGGTFATYTAAGDIRRGLANAGFTVERVPGFGRKRHMTCGHLA